MAKYIDSNGLSHLIGKIKGWAVPQTRKINNKPLSADISLTPSDIGAAASGDLSSYVPTTRKVNGKALSTDISLTASDVGALSNDTTIPSPGTGSNLPKMDGTSSLGSSDGYARVDHIHPTDTSRQATLVSGTNIKTIGSQSLLGSGNLTAANIGAAASSHTHGDITNAGDITATAPTIANGDKLIINDESESKITNGPSFGTSTTTFLANNGTWQTPAGTYSHPTTTAAEPAAKKVGNDAQGHVVLGDALTASDVGAATSSHTHGNITSSGDITATAPTIASGDCLVINDDSASKITNGPAFGSSTTTYLRNDGSWGTPVGTTYSDATTSTHGLMSAADKTKLDKFRVSANIPHATCNTAAGTAYKVAKLDNNDTFTLEAGAVVAVTFEHGDTNTNAAIELNVNSTGSKGILLNNMSPGQFFSWNDYETVIFTYDGTNWQMEPTQKCIMNLKEEVGNKSPLYHASSSEGYGKGTASNYGHVKLSDVTDGTAAAASGGIAATPKAVADALAAAKTYADNNDADTKNTAGSTDSSSKLFIIGATGQAANPQTYSQDTAYVGTDGHLYSDSKQVVNLSGTQALTNKTYNGYTLATACTKSVDTSISSGSTSTNLPTTAAVADYVDNAVTVASSGALTYKGTVSAETGITGVNYKQGWYWIVTMPQTTPATTSVTIGGIECEAGDMIIAKQDKTATLANDIDIVQSNISVIGNTEIDTIWTNASAS